MDDSVRYPTVTSARLDLSGWFALFVGLLRSTVYLGVLGGLILVALTYPWAWLFVLFWVLIMALVIAALLRGRRAGDRIRRIQERAAEITGAAHMGSAVHTAGHPLLRVDQPVLLALTAGELAIYDYSSSTPLDKIPLSKILSVAAVVTDDEGVPHKAVADMSARALQISFTWRGHPCEAVFRMMRKMRPIDWYQAIQTARLMA